MERAFIFCLLLNIASTRGARYEDSAVHIIANAQKQADSNGAFEVTNKQTKEIAEPVGWLDVRSESDMFGVAKRCTRRTGSAMGTSLEWSKKKCAESNACLALVIHSDGEQVDFCSSITKLTETGGEHLLIKLEDYADIDFNVVKAGHGMILSDDGIVTEVTSKSQAAKLGIKPGWQVVKIGTAQFSLGALKEVVENKESTQITFSKMAYNHIKFFDVMVTFDLSQISTLKTPKLADLGLEIDPEDHATVVWVKPSSQADKLGVQKGWMLNEYAARLQQDFAARLQQDLVAKTKTVSFQVMPKALKVASTCGILKPGSGVGPASCLGETLFNLEEKTTECKMGVDCPVTCCS